MTDTLETKSRNHLKYLDSARGIAALMVCISHFLDNIYNGSPALKYVFLVINGNDAVAFFFVLSGFVLSYKYLVHKKSMDIKKFWVSRVFRLFPPFFVTVVVTALVIQRNDMSMQKLADLFIFNKLKFWEEALLIRFHSFYYFPGWTLTIEMLVSFPIALFIALAMKDRRYALYLWFAFAIQGVQFNTHFIMGIVLCAYFSDLTAGSFQKTKLYRYRYALIAIAMFFFSMRHVAKISPFGSTYVYLADYLGIDYFFYSGLASFIFLGAIIISRRTQRFLQTRVLIFVGKTSYGIYLMHPMALILVINYVLPYSPDRHTVMGFIVPFLAYMALFFGLASLMHKYIEMPSIAWGKRIAARMKPSLVASSVEQ